MSDKSEFSKNSRDLPEEAAEVFEKFLKSQKLSVTKSRINLVKAIYELDGHFDFEQLREHLNKKDVDFHTTSLFRTIKLLIQAGLLEKIRTNSHRRVAFELTLGEHHHDHLVCDQCGSIIEFYDEKIEKIQDEICEKYKFKLLFHSLVMTGICASCQQAAAIQKRSPLNVIREI